MSKRKRIAIIGAGASGLTSIKSCLEVGFEPVCFEKSAHIGGLWRYHEEDTDGAPSVMRSTIINTSKEKTAFSDFPFSAHLPNYMHNTKILDYLQQYAEHFKLLKYIKYNWEIIKVEQAPDYDRTGCWTISAKNVKTTTEIKEIFHAVMVCSGHHVYPYLPSFPDQQKFKGSIMHTHKVKSCDQFKGQKVAVVGIGNSGVDAAIEATIFGKQVYLSTRRGSWIIARVAEGGLPYDIKASTRMKSFLNSFRSFDSICDDVEKYLNSRFDHASYGLKPNHRFLSAHPTCNDALPNAILSGKVVIKGDIERFEANGIVFVGENNVTELDTVILATGYQIKFPFLANDVLAVNDNRVHLYKYIIPPHLKHPSLAMIGLIQPLGSVFPVSELQSRWFMQVLLNNLKLPSSEEMEKDTARKREANAKLYVDSPRHTIQVYLQPYLDELAEMIGAKPNFFKMAILDPKLFRTCVLGPVVSYQYRLVGPHSWHKARDTILTYEERIYGPLNKQATKLSRSTNKLFTYRNPLSYVLGVAVAGIAIKCMVI